MYSLTSIILIITFLSLLSYVTKFTQIYTVLYLIIIPFVETDLFTLEVWYHNRRISGKGVYWGKGESHEFSKKAWKPVVTIRLLLLLPKKSLGWVKNVTFWVIQKNMKFDRKCVENVWYSGAIISSTKVQVLHHFGKLRQNAFWFHQ